MILQQHGQKSAPLGLLRNCDSCWFNKFSFNVISTSQLFHMLIPFPCTKPKNILYYLSHIVKPGSVVRF